MTKEPKRPVFVERRTYRRRRMADAAGLLPVFGVALFGIPLLWGGEASQGALTSDVMIYVFGIWVALAVLAAVVSRDLGREGDPGTDPGAGSGDNASPVVRQGDATPPEAR